MKPRPGARGSFILASRLESARSLHPELETFIGDLELGGIWLLLQIVLATSPEQSRTVGSCCPALLRILGFLLVQTGRRRSRSLDFCRLLSSQLSAKSGLAEAGDVSPRSISMLCSCPWSWSCSCNSLPIQKLTLQEGPELERTKQSAEN